MSGVGKVNSTKPSIGVIDLNKPAQTFKFVMGLCAVIFLVAVLFFSFLRTRFRQIYSPRLLLIENKVFITGTFLKSFFSWISPALTVTDEDIYAFAGMDALIFLRFLRLVLKLALLTLPYGMLVLLPINVNGQNKLVDGLDKLSMSNVSKHSSTLWAHWLAIWLYSFAIFYLTYKEWIVYIKFRQRYLMKGSGSQFSVFVQNIPKSVEDERALKDVLDELFPNKIAGIHHVQDLTTWDALVERHDKYVLKLESAKNYLEKKKKRPITTNFPCGKKYDAIMEIESELEIIQEGLLREKDTKKESLQCAFVVFKSLKSQNASLRSVWTTDPLEFNAEQAPNANEVVWNNLHYSPFIRNIKIAIGYVFIFFMVVFYAVPISFISSLTHLKSLADEFKWLESIKEGSSQWVLNFIQGVLPVALLGLFYLCLPYILFAVARFQGRISQSDMAMMVFKCLFVFQTFNTFFIYIISGSVLQYISQVIAQPFELPNLLAKSLPSQAGFFINYLALVSMVGLAIELTRIAQLIIITIKLKCFAKTQRERLEAWRPKRAEYEIMYSQALLFLLIGLSYSVLSPIIIPFFVMFFAFGYVVWTYQLLHVYIPEYEHGGKFWPEVFYRMMVVLVVFQLLMVGVLLLKRMWYAAVLTAPVIIIAVFYWWFMADKYKRCGDLLALSEAKNTSYAEKRFLEDVRKRYIRNYTLPDVFELSTDKYDDLENYNPRKGSLNDTDDDGQEMSENGRLLAR